MGQLYGTTYREVRRGRHVRRGNGRHGRHLRDWRWLSTVNGDRVVPVVESTLVTLRNKHVLAYTTKCLWRQGGNFRLELEHYLNFPARARAKFEPCVTQLSRLTERQYPFS